MRKWVRSLVVVAVSFALSVTAGWVYLTWDLDAPEEGAWIAPIPAPAEDPTPGTEPGPSRKDILSEEIRALTASIREVGRPAPRELTDAAEAKIEELLSDPQTTAHTVGTLPWPDDVFITWSPPVPFRDGEITYFSFELLRGDGGPMGLLKYQDGETVSTSACSGRVEALRAVELDGVPYAAAFEADDESGAYIAVLFGVEDGRLTRVDRLNTGIKTHGDDRSLSAEIEDGVLTVSDAAQPQGGQCRLVKKDGALRFEHLPAIASAEAPADFTAYGLLLGLSDDADDLRTLWIRPAGGRLWIDEISDAVVFPYRDGFSWLKNVRHTYEKTEEDYTSTFDLSKPGLAPLGENPFTYLEVLADDPADWGQYSESTDRLYYVGDEYVCYGNRYTYQSGGTLNYGLDYVRMVPLEAVNRVILGDTRPEEDDEYPQLGRIKLYNLLVNEALQTLGASPAIDFGFERYEYLSLADMALVHNYGRWNLAAPVFSKRYTPGNGSGGTHFVKFLPLGGDLPESLTGFEGLPDGVDMYALQSRLQASDAVSPPDLKSVVAIGENGVSVCDSELNELLTVPTRSGERVVSVRWAAPGDVAAWGEALSPYVSEE